MRRRRSGGTSRRTRGRSAAPRRTPVRTLMLVILAFGVGWLAHLAWPGPLRPSADAAVPGVAPVSVRIASYSAAGGGVEVTPSSGGADTLLILYPGGLVRPHAYTWIGVALAPVGVRTLIPTMPFDLAVLGRDRAARLREELSEGEAHVVLAGHSLGGAMAAAHLAASPDTAEALVLMGAYPGKGDDLRGADLPVLALAAEHDGLATLDEVRAGMSRLPDRGGIEVIDGAVHAFFGRYGPQRGDGLPSVPRSVAEAEIAGALEAFLGSLR